MWEIKESFKKMLGFWKMLTASPRSGLKGPNFNLATCC